MTKPSDFFVSVVDFFSIILPGALVVFILQDFAMTQIFGLILPKITTELSQWIVYVFASYLVGNFISLVSPWLDPLYVRIYAKYQQAIAEQGGKPKIPQRLRIFWRSLKYPDKISDGPLLIYSKELKKGMLKDAEIITGKSHNKLMNTIRWATALVRIQNPLAASDIDRVEASSKFFRSLTISLLFISIYFAFYLPFTVFMSCIFLMFLSGWRYMNLRWRRTTLTLEYFVAISKIMQIEPKNSKLSTIEAGITE